MSGAFQVVLLVKNPPANAGDVRPRAPTPGSVRFPGEGNCNPLQYYCLGNSMDRRAWQATIHGVTSSQIQLSTHICTHTGVYPALFTLCNTINTFSS